MSTYDDAYETRFARIQRDLVELAYDAAVNEEPDTDEILNARTYQLARHFRERLGLELDHAVADWVGEPR